MSEWSLGLSVSLGVGIYCFEGMEWGGGKLWGC